MSTFPPVAQQMRILMRGVDFGDAQTYTNMEKELRERLQESYDSGRPLRVYCGFDPSSPDLHLGHTIPMRKLRQFQDLGHDVTFLIGTFTGMVGDPSDKESARRQQTLDDALEKAASYANQAFRVLDRSKTAIRYNHEWLQNLSFGDVVRLASNFTVQQFLTRENFAKRLARNDAIWVHEFFYALMQGYDAVALRTDIQIGGTDQLFNLMAGRKLMEAHGLRPQVVLTFPILEGTDGVLRMSKSAGNYIGIDEPPGVIFTKVLNLPDNVMRNYAQLVTRWPQRRSTPSLPRSQTGQLEVRGLKHKLAWEIVSIFQGDAAADQAERDAAAMHGGQAPSDAPVLALAGPMNILDVLLEGGVVKSKGEAQGGSVVAPRAMPPPCARVIQGKACASLRRRRSPPMSSWSQPKTGREVVIQAGKRKFLRIVRAQGVTKPGAITINNQRRSQQWDYLAAKQGDGLWPGQQEFNCLGHHPGAAQRRGRDWPELCRRGAQEARRTAGCQHQL
jgi:tyrosyl-tRNA synthetase